MIDNLRGKSGQGYYVEMTVGSPPQKVSPDPRPRRQPLVWGPLQAAGLPAREALARHPAAAGLPEPVASCSAPAEARGGGLSFSRCRRSCRFPGSPVASSRGGY
uniref:Uncharacterized protein n=1 Tax=Sphaerodactylus townsendi TaxID=933632 RepID=A0ACB8EY19_9SAUR